MPAFDNTLQDKKLITLDCPCHFDKHLLMKPISKPFCIH